MPSQQKRPSESESRFEVESDDADGELLAARYQMLEELGSGSFGVVYKAIEKASGEIVAIKHVRLIDKKSCRPIPTNSVAG
jgi:serine/threonine protein kinase